MKRYVKEYAQDLKDYFEAKKDYLISINKDGCNDLTISTLNAYILEINDIVKKCNLGIVTDIEAVATLGNKYWAR